tara:strand:- start:3951 stop:4214 length:264 start_codon:yes stop_codon:yes gene_type:complete
VIECLLVGGLFYIAGIDLYEKPYMLSVNSIVKVTEHSEQAYFSSENTYKFTAIYTVNSPEPMIKEDASMIKVLESLVRCEKLLGEDV